MNLNTLVSTVNKMIHPDYYITIEGRHGDIVTLDLFETSSGGKNIEVNHSTYMTVPDIEVYTDSNLVELFHEAERNIIKQQEWFIHHYIFGDLTPHVAEEIYALVNIKERLSNNEGYCYASTADIELYKT